MACAGGAPGGTIEGVEEDGEKETLAALAADPEREPLAKDSVEIEAMSGPRTVTYTNDAINRLSMNDPNDGIPTNYDRNHLNQYTSVTGHGSLSYDGNLNVSGYDGWAFVHDAEKRLLSVTGNGHSAQFAYDGLGRCVKRIIDGATTLFTYDNWKPVAEWTGTGVFVAWNLYGAGPDEILVRYQQNPAGYLHYHLDAMGNVQFLLSDQSNPGLEKYTYDVFGKPTIIGWNGDVRPISNHGNRFLFTGREYLYTFGLYDYRHRIYHPGLGRFIQTDPLGLQIEGTKLSAQQTALYALGGVAPEKFSSSELNLYRYCHNHPINKSDPMGLDVEFGTRPWFVAPHWFISVTDSAQGGRMHYFEFYGNDNRLGGPGKWNDSLNKPSQYTVQERFATTPEQDFVVLDALKKSQADPPNYSPFTANCEDRAKEVYNNALFSNHKVIDPLDRKTGNITNARGETVGWEDPHTGNIYNSKGEWSGWNKNYKESFKMKSGQ